jgi:membrane protease YdiL (CAAX protease family)
MDRDATLTPVPFERAAGEAWSERAQIVVPVLILVVIGAVEPLRPVGVLVLLAGLLSVGRPLRPATLAWAAVLPVAIELAWPILMGRDGALGELCANPFTDIVLRRFAQVALILTVVAVLGRSLGLGPSSIGLRRASVPALALAGGAGILVAVLGIVVGPMLTTPFFGKVGFVAPLVTIVPALLFAIANGVLEEVTYRGVLLCWFGRLVGIPTALVVQAIVFGLAHAGPEIAPAMLPLHIAIMAACGLALGLLVLRTRSLTVAVGVHIGADVALYYGLACRTL